jgi:hypothetical protein
MGRVGCQSLRCPIEVLFIFGLLCRFDHRHFHLLYLFQFHNGEKMVCLSADMIEEDNFEYDDDIFADVITHSSPVPHDLGCHGNTSGSNLQDEVFSSLFVSFCLFVRLFVFFFVLVFFFNVIPGLKRIVLLS